MTPLPFIDIPVPACRATCLPRGVASAAVVAARKAGIIKSEGHCMRCDQLTESPNYHAHHPDYSMPGRVTMLCACCHRQVHRNSKAA